MEAKELDVVTLIHALHDGLSAEFPPIVRLLQLLKVSQGLCGYRVGSNNILDERGQMKKGHGTGREDNRHSDLLDEADSKPTLASSEDTSSTHYDRFVPFFFFTISKSETICH